MRDFWLSCGHHLLDRDQDGRVIATDEFLKAYLARSELAPPPEADAAERALHRALLDDARRAVAAGEIAAIDDADARENWQVMLAFRDHLIAHPTIEAAYLALMREALPVPALFVDQLVQVILRNMLDGTDDAFILRAAELFFRPQQLSVRDGLLLAADAEHVEQLGESPLVAMLGLPSDNAIDVLSDDNAQSYWERSDRFDFALDLTAGRRGLAALGAVIERWIAHLFGLTATIEPVIALHDVVLSWYVGLDAEATKLGDLLWHGGTLSEDDSNRIVGLFRLTFADAAPVLERVAGEPVYLILAMAPDGGLRMKPQNLVTGLPLRALESVP
jgi:hypothetical protein